MQKDAIIFYEPYDILYQPFWREQWFFIAVVLCIVLCALGLVWFIISRYRGKKKPMTPWDRALEGLQGIVLNESACGKDGKNVYSTITSILKKYFYERYGYFLDGKTDSEVVEYLHDQHFDPKLIEIFTTIVDAATRFKFADEKARMIDMKAALDHSQFIVKTTIPKPQISRGA